MDPTTDESSQKPSPAYYDLGTYSRPVTTSNDEAQRWFDRGLIWSFAFNHEEAAACFERAIASDAECPMAYWGLAYTLGPNYNKPWDFFDAAELQDIVRRTHAAVETAREKAATRGSPVEKSLIYALESRYPHASADHNGQTAEWNSGYADAMAKVHNSFPRDLDVAALFADALMNLTPWQLWDLSTGEPAEHARTLEAKAILDQALAQPGGMQHPGLLHLYIHLMEMSSTPEAALPAADRLRNLVPDAGHLQHMPTHIDLLLGDYQRGMKSNQAAIVADETYLEREGPLKFYTLYRMHDYHFRIYCAMFAGQRRIALETAERMNLSLSPELLKVKSPPMADWLEGFASIKLHVLIRFGMWQEILNDILLPEDQELYSVTTAMTHYAKGVAASATGDVSSAEVSRAAFSEAMGKVPESRMLFNNKCVDILGVASLMLDGELEYRKGNMDIAFSSLHKAIEACYALPYDEPWGWMQPPSHALGALLLEQGRHEEAAKAYADDLGIKSVLPRALQHPNNVWALHGYHECLLKLGRNAEAQSLHPELDRALRAADVSINASCFCRRQTQSGQ
ncbi:TPR domain protein [Microdochium trichocladiopsis]|uniref:TPR domain protein n=1 Tax=Microdochium trichocladiopsis TaxID=1682393 RepID=A0A9P8Y715_9PEZI|nr:TPR domain protein [Microdochium trichocladiopsis]KAH7029316.1 TPR domain protein [Microdochium trichocladiopsis]